jgi:hypothetical protein
MVMRLAALALGLAGFAASAQEPLPWAGKGTVRAAATFSYGHLLRDRRDDSNYLSGKLEAFVEDRVSLRGEAFWFTGGSYRQDLYDGNSLLCAGPFWNWHIGRLNPAIGFQPGISIARASERTGPARVLPNASLCAGLTYTVWDHFHFFADARYLHARFHGLSAGEDISEFIWGAGLGLHIR